MKNYYGLVSLPILIKKPIVKFNRLKKLPGIVLLFFSVVHLIYAQENTLLIQTSSKQDSIILSKINYQKQFPDANSLNLELDSVLNQVHLLGFIEALWIDKKHISNQTSVSLLLGKPYQGLILYSKSALLTDEIKQKLNIQDSIQLNFQALGTYLEGKKEKLNQLGYPFAVVKASHLIKKDEFIYGELLIIPNEKRNINAFVIKGYTSFPKNFLKQISKKYKHLTFSEQNLIQLNKELNTLRFVRQTKNPEILFNTDSTQVYLYLEKSKSNRFDGLLGATTNKEGNTILNGYVDLLLINAFNKGEQLSVYWKNNGEEQKTFNLSGNFPYVFKTPLGFRGDLNIFSEGKSFQNTKIGSAVDYYFNFNSNLFIGYEKNQSSTIQNTSVLTQDFESYFYSIGYHYKRLFEENWTENWQTRIKFGNGVRTSTTQKSTQQLLDVYLEKNIVLHALHQINVRTNHFILFSDDFLTNELHRFGGINSIRGFNENSLQANQAHSLLTEYRFFFSNKSYLHTVTDYGYAYDRTIEAINTFKSFGFGIGLQSKSGLMQLIYANGTAGNQSFNISNSIVHVGFKSSF